MKNMTMRKLKNRGLTPIRYRTKDEVRHGYIVGEGPKGGLIVRLVGDDRNRRVSKDECRYITNLA